MVLPSELGALLRGVLLFLGPNEIKVGTPVKVANTTGGFLGWVATCPSALVHILSFVCVGCVFCCVCVFLGNCTGVKPV